MANFTTVLPTNTSLAADEYLLRQGIVDRKQTRTVLSGGVAEDLVGEDLLVATDTTKGLVELATQAETDAGIDATRAITPETLDGRDATTTLTGLSALATNAEIQNGTGIDKVITSSGLPSRTATESRTGLAALATQGEVDSSTGGNTIVTPETLGNRTSTDTRRGLIELATQNEVNIGLDEIRSVTPATMRGCTSTTTRIGVIATSTDLEVETGTSTTKAVTPSSLRALTPDTERLGLIELATQNEVNIGTDAVRAVTPATLQGKVDGNVKGVAIQGNSPSSVGMIISNTSSNPADAILHVIMQSSNQLYYYPCAAPLRFYYNDTTSGTVRINEVSDSEDTVFSYNYTAGNDTLVITAVSGQLHTVYAEGQGL